MLRRNLLPAAFMIVIAATQARGESGQSFDSSRLLKAGDEAKYGSYIVV